MSRKKESIKGGSCVPRIRENSRLMQAHESVVDLISGRSQHSFLDSFSTGLFGFDFSLFRALQSNLENDLIYSDSDDEDDEEDDFVYSHSAAQRALAPHPQIRQLTPEEEERHEKELLEEGEKRKDRAVKNKRKKLRKKEKKRLEKENAVKEVLPEEEPESKSSENQEENIIESKMEAEECAAPLPGETQNEAVVTGCDASRGGNDDNVKMKKEGDGKTKDLDLKSSFVSAAASVAKEPLDHAPSTERKGKKTQLPVIQKPEEKKSEVLEEPEVQPKKTGDHDNSKKETTDACVEDFAKRSAELAAIGNRLAASGQFEVAVRCFTDAIKYNPKEFKLFGNRSLCYERMQLYEKALIDADLALSMEPNWIKGLFRKGKALCGLKRYYEASLIYKEVLRQNDSSAEAARELKRAQTLHLMEMGFTRVQSSDALRAHATLEEAVDALFGCEGRQAHGDGQASIDTNQLMVEEQEEDGEQEGKWTVLPTSRPRMQQQMKMPDAAGQTRPKSQSPTPLSRNGVKQELFPIWVGSLAPTVSYATLHTVFSRAGTVYSVKMLLDHQCAFVHYGRREDCERAIQLINGMVVEGAPLSVRYPNKIHPELGVSKLAATESFSRPVAPLATGKNLKECFFWRTTGCTKQDKCIYRHVPEHKNIDKDKFKL